MRSRPTWLPNYKGPIQSEVIGGFAAACVHRLAGVSWTRIRRDDRRRRLTMRHLEDFKEGQVFELGEETIREQEILDFAVVSMRSRST